MTTIETFVVSGMGFLSTTNNYETIYCKESSADMPKLLILMVESLIIDVILVKFRNCIVLIRLSYATTLIDGVFF